MRIMHIGDLHFKPKNSFDQNQMIKSFLTTAESLGQVDAIFFSGDLVDNGTEKQDFENAYAYLITPLVQKLKLSEDFVFYCQGNHDVDRTRSLGAIIREFSERKVSKVELQKWYEKEIPDREASFAASANYYQFAKQHISTKDESHVLYSLHYREISGKKIGIVTLNSSWFSSGIRPDDNQLLFPPFLLQELISKTESCDYKIIMFHHPLTFFKEPISFELQDLVHGHFNILLNGHVHKEYISTQFKYDNGIYCNTTKATLCYDGGEIGFSLLDVDFNEPEIVKVKRYHYIKAENTFSELQSIVAHVSVGEDKEKQNKLRRKIVGKYLLELEDANSLLLNYDETSGTGFLETFTEPGLSKNSDEQSALDDSLFRVAYSDLKNSTDNLIIFGKDKCGKTSLLKRLHLDFLHDYPTTSIVPFYFDYKHLEAKGQPFNLVKLLVVYYQLTRAEVEKVINEGRLVLLIDNLDTGSSLHQEIIATLSNNRQIRFIVCSEYLASRVYAEELDDLDYIKIFFKNLNRKQIRSYAEKIPSLKNEDHDLVIEKVTAFCKQLQLPLNYWIVSLILLIYKKSNDDYSKNLFNVLDACVDEILQKKRFLFEKTTLKFEQYKSLCGIIAHSLFKNHHTTDYSAECSEIIQIIELYNKTNPRVNVTGDVIFNFLADCGLLKKKAEGTYTFRLNGIFEYFLAYHMKENVGFREEVLDNPNYYLSFKNELEIYSGFNRGDVAFLKRIFEKTKSSLEVFKSSYGANLDDTLIEKIDKAYNFDKKIRDYIVNRPLSDKEKDQAFDNVLNEDINSEVRAKKEIDVTKLDIEIIEKYLSILARVFKNLDAITDAKLIYDIFDYLLETYCQFGFYMVDSFEETSKFENLKVREDGSEEVDEDFIIGEELLKLISKILPVLIQSMLYDGIGQLNVSKIVEEKIREFRTEAKKNQYKLFVLYFLLVDLDLKGNKSLIEDIFAEITLSPLKVSTLFKLNFYLAFKVGENKTLEQQIKNQIQSAQLRLDNKSDANSIQGGLSRKSRRNLIKRASKS